jgi:response regulator RpfG family c-di-GMP phosphodiesterase
MCTISTAEGRSVQTPLVLPQQQEQPSHTAHLAEKHCAVAPPLQLAQQPVQHIHLAARLHNIFTC